jgi:hypothetical protein
MQKDYTLIIRKTIIFIELINGYQKAASYRQQIETQSEYDGKPSILAVRDSW